MKLKELCEICDIEYNKSHPKRSLNKIKQKYIIEEINFRDYKIIGKLIKNQKIKSNKYKQFQIDDVDSNKAGIYKIELDDTIYIGQTNNFYKRFIYHYGGHNDNINVTNMLKNNGVMTIIELENDKKLRLEKEAKWSYYYLNKGYNVINNFNVLYNKNKVKNSFKIIKIYKEDYDKALELLKNNNIKIKDKK